MSKNDGGPAFPVPQRDGEAWHNGHPDGMTLRDWFAGQALAGLCSIGRPSVEGPGGFASTAYAMADAMLREREASEHDD